MRLKYKLACLVVVVLIPLHLVLLAIAAHGAGPPVVKPAVTWTIDKPFAHKMAARLNSADPTFQVTQIVCKKSHTSKAAVSVGIAPEDCLVISQGATSLFCGEVFAATSGAVLDVVSYTCSSVARAFKRDVKSSDSIRFVVRPAPPAVRQVPQA